jgi:hypothetical protein
LPAAAAVDAEQVQIRAAAEELAATARFLQLWCLARRTRSSSELEEQRLKQAARKQPTEMTAPLTPPPPRAAAALVLRLQTES